MEMSDGITQEDLKLFLQEADEQIQVLDEDITRLEKESGNSDLMQEIFRAAHTVKGSSAMVGNQRMSELAHAMENVLDNVRKGALTVSPQVIDALLHGLDVIRRLREEMVTDGAAPIEISDCVAELTAALNAGEQSVARNVGPVKGLSLDDEARIRLDKARQEGKNAYRIEVAFDPKTEWASVRCFQVVRELSSLADILATAPSQQEIEGGKAGCLLQLMIAGSRSEDEIKSLLGTVPDIVKIEVSACSVAKPAETTVTKPSVSADITTDKSKGETRSNQTVRVDVSRLDTLLEQVGELIVKRNQLSQLGRIVGEKHCDDEAVRNLANGVVQIAKIIGMLQQDVMTIRLQPVEIVFGTLPRMMRDLARKENKKIDFIIEGQETEVDRSVIEHLRDPLMHLLRNAADHGIETPEERIAAGKPETGTVRLSAHHEQDRIVIKLEDDGKGINPELLRQTAVRKGFLSADAAAMLSDKEAINLILRSGFSTAKKVTEISGRGVGMDVVATNIEALGGTVDIASEIGRWTQFTLTLPLTLAIIPALLVATGEAICAVPLSSIVETCKLEAGDIKTVNRKEVTLFRGSVLPLLRLGVFFGWEDDVERKTEATYVVVVKANGIQVGITVDALLEQQELVVKSLDKFVRNNIITGASILGDGRVGLILDVPSLIKSAVADRHNTNRIGGERLPAMSLAG
jgi:two-component system, chemotaxis family, sensor kinase CheA